MSSSLSASSTPQIQENKLAYYSIVAIFCLSIINSIRNIEREAVIPYLPVVLLATLIGSSITLLCTKKINYKHFKNPLFISLNIFGLFILFSTFYSKYPFLTATRSLQFILVTNSLYIIISYIKNIKNIFETIADITIKFTFVASIYGIFIYLFVNFSTINGISVTKINLLGIELAKKMYGHRISSFLGNPNSFGIYLMISSLICLYFLKEYKNKKYALLLVLFLYTLILTGSRASMVGLIGGASIFIAYSYFKNNLAATTLRVLLITIFISICTYLVLNPETIKDIFSLMGRASNTLSGREVAWAALINQIKETPFFGIGYRISTEAVLEDNFIDVSNSHNLYLSILTEIGLVGFALFICLISYLIFIYFIKVKKNYNYLTTSLISLLCSLLINQFFEDIFSPLSYLFLYLFFIIFLIEKTQMKSHKY